jgi:hypothetical protein
VQAYLLDVVVGKGAAILELLASKDQSLLVRGDALLVLNLGLDIVDRVGGLDLKGDGLARQGLHKTAHVQPLVHFALDKKMVIANHPSSGRRCRFWEGSGDCQSLAEAYICTGKLLAHQCLSRFICSTRLFFHVQLGVNTHSWLILVTVDDVKFRREDRFPSSCAAISSQTWWGAVAEERKP